MSSIPDLTSLGCRIMVCGPSSNGKSTLAVALSARLGVPVVHLDRLKHYPNTNWTQRPDAEFAALHEAAIGGEAWIIDGNYTRLMAPRLARATGIILLGANRWANLFRYFRRTLFERRAGHLEGAPERIQWSMIHWIMVTSPQNLKTYKEKLPAFGLPLVEVRTFQELMSLYAAWGLDSAR